MTIAQLRPDRTIRHVTPDEIRQWPATVDVVTALAAFGIGRETAYRMAKDGSAPVPILRLGRRLRVARSAVMTALGISEVQGSAAAPPGKGDQGGAEAA